MNYVGEIRMFAGNFAPNGWMFCEGQLLPISENEVLFQLIGTTYGGDGESTFALPNLASRFPMHQGNGFTIGETGGSEAVTLTVQQIPIHTHVPTASTAVGDAVVPDNNVWAKQGSLVQFKGSPDPNIHFDALMAPNTIGLTGGSQPHENMSPYLCINFIISLFGVYPPAN
ncbi:MAG TPA: tail fiber protein [Pyrinomonadaceae bacterium]|nr:tail fiber protein [Pyrinomonadaceae bacterium]